MEEGSGIDQRFLIGAGFSLGTVILSSLVGSIIGSVRTFSSLIPEQSWSMTTVAYIFLVLVTYGISLVGLMLLETSSPQLCTVQVLMETTFGQIAQVVLLYLFIHRIASSLLHRRKRIALYGLVFLRFGLGALYSATTRILNDRGCRPVHQASFRITLAVFDVLLDLCMGVLIVQTTLSVNISAKRRLRTGLLVLISLPYHFSIVLELLPINYALGHNTVNAALQTMLVLGLLFDAECPAIDSIPLRDRVFLDTRSLHQEWKEDKLWPQTKIDAQNSDDKSTVQRTDTFEKPRLAPQAPQRSELRRDDTTRNPFYKTARHKDLVSKDKTVAIGQHGADQVAYHQARTITASVEDTISPGNEIWVRARGPSRSPLDSSANLRERSASDIPREATLQHIRKASVAGQELFVFDLEGGLITPIRTSVPWTYAGSERSSVYSDFSDHAHLLRGKASQSSLVSNEYHKHSLPDYMQYEAIARAGSDAFLQLQGIPQVPRVKMYWDTIDYGRQDSARSRDEVKRPEQYNQYDKLR